ncbi:MAG: hypothetical protein ACFFD1_10090 [Candidatus Thorarchaeota archaeon]
MALSPSTETTIILTGLTLKGPDIINHYPSIALSSEQRIAIAMKSLPIGGQCGDMVNISLNDLQIICILFVVSAFELGIDKRDTTVSLGIMIPNNINPLPYQNVLRNIAEICKQRDLMKVAYLESIMKELYETIINEKKNQFSIEVEGSRINFSIDKNIELKKETFEASQITNSTQLEPVLSKEEIFARETNAFIVDKFVLSTIVNEFPIKIEDIWRKALKLETMIGSRLELGTIIEICKKYLDQGIIRKV